MDKEEKKPVKPKKLLTEEQKRRMREYERKRRQDPEYRAKIYAKQAEYRKRMQEDPEYRAKKCAKNAEYYRKRCQQDPEYRAKIYAKQAEYRKRRQENPEYRAKRNARQRERRIAAKAQQQQPGEQSESNCSISDLSNSNSEPVNNSGIDSNLANFDENTQSEAVNESKKLLKPKKVSTEEQKRKMRKYMREYMRKRYQDPEYRAKINARRRERRRIAAKAHQQPCEQSESNAFFPDSSNSMEPTIDQLKDSDFTDNDDDLDMIEMEIKDENDVEEFLARLKGKRRPEAIQPHIENQPEPKIKEEIEAKQSLPEKKSGAGSASLEQTVKVEIEEDSSTDLDLAKLDQEIREDLEAFWSRFHRARLNQPESTIGQEIDEDSDDDDSVDFDLIDQLMREEAEFDQLEGKLMDY